MDAPPDMDDSEVIRGLMAQRKQSPGVMGSMLSKLTPREQRAYRNAYAAALREFLNKLPEDRAGPHYTYSPDASRAEQLYGAAMK